MKDLLVGIVSSAIVTVAASYFVYGWGYNDGFRAGTTKGVAEISKELEDEIENRRREFEQNLEKRKSDFEQQLTNRKKEFEEDLEGRKRKFEADLDNIVEQRYSDRLIEAHQEGIDKGMAKGYSDGMAYGRKECQSACERRIEELNSYGRLWASFVNSVNRFVEKNPRTETEMRSLALAIVNTAETGREAASKLVPQLNGLVNEIAEALKAGDLETVKELIKALQPTLDTKGEAWRKNFEILTRYE